ncbi:sciellin isoform X3 [Notolabrus celidotus]|uniref:sciellin isoform X3 n=1 Tax=Notolabrus celidotus TaxID=1203425 RepID=UPI0014904013|nr:sciellin isoform X3 [Notolabrus celidotus]
MALRTGLLKDGSWIKKADDEEEDIDRDPNFGKTILGKRNSGESNSSIQSEEINTTRSTTTSSVQALSKRFGGSSDDLVGSPTSYKPNSSTTTTTVTKDGKTTETTITTSGGLRSPVIKSPTKTDTFTERVLKASSKGSEDKLFDTLIPSSVKNTYSPMDSETSVSSTETVTVRSSNNGDVKTTTTTRSSSSAEDDLYSTLLPKAITSGLSPSISSSSSSSITRREYITVESSRGLETQISSSPTSTRRTTSYSSYNDDIPSSRTTSYTINTKSSDIYDTDNKSYSYSKPDSSYNSISSPSSYSSTTYRSSSRSDDSLSDPIYSRSSTKNVYGSSERAVLEKDLCTYCHKPFTGDAKMVLDEMKINCHVTCFKCEVCNRTLEHLKAGDSMWVYKHMVHCENCFDSTRERWRL